MIRKCFLLQSTDIVVSIRKTSASGEVHFASLTLKPSTDKLLEQSNVKAAGNSTAKIKLEHALKSEKHDAELHHKQTALKIQLHGWMMFQYEL